MKSVRVVSVAVAVMLSGPAFASSGAMPPVAEGGALVAAAPKDKKKDDKKEEAAPADAKPAEPAPAPEPAPAEKPAEAAPAPAAEPAPAGDPKPADGTAATTEPKPADGTTTEPGEETEEAAAEDELSFKDRYFPFTFREGLHPLVEKQKVMYIVLSLLLGNFVPFPHFWLPLVMWNPKPEFDSEHVLKPALIKIGIQLAGHAVIAVPWLCCIGPGWYLLYFPMLIMQIAWGAVNWWTYQVFMVHAWDDAVKAQNLEAPPEGK